jgi:hypothetical protein
MTAEELAKKILHVLATEAERESSFLTDNPQWEINVMHIADLLIEEGFYTQKTMNKELAAIEKASKAKDD